MPELDAVILVDFLGVRRQAERARHPWPCHYVTLTGQTWTLLGALPAAVRSRTRAFCLRAVAETLPRITPLAPITAGFTAPGRLDVDVSFINASGLVNRGAIRREGQPALAFYERLEWIRAWLPDHAAEVLDLCARVSDLLRQEE